jgi:hypothetical protein
VFSGGVSDLVFLLFGFIYLESNLLTSVGFSKTSASPRWSSASFGPATSSHGCADSSRSTHGLHEPGRSLPGGACRSQLVFQGTIGGFSMDPKSSDRFLLQTRSPVAACELHAPSSVSILAYVLCCLSCLFTVYLYDA